MNCPNCGTSNLDTASICANCGKPLAGAPSHSYTPPPGSHSYTPPAGQRIPNYLLPSILVTFCCCQPLGIVAIVFAAMVNSKIASGDTAGALNASKNAKLFCWIALGLTVLAWVLGWTFGGMAYLEDIREAMESR